MLLLPFLLLAAPPALPTVDTPEVFIEALASDNGVGTTGGGALGARVAIGHLSVAGRCSVQSGSFALFTPNGGVEEHGQRLSCFADAGPQFDIGPVTARITLGAGAALEQVGAIAPLVVTAAGASAGLRITHDLAIVADARIESAMGLKGLGGGFVVGAGLAMRL